MTRSRKPCVELFLMTTVKTRKTLRHFSRQSFRLCSQGLRLVLTCIFLMILSVLLTGPDCRAGENESTTRTNISLLDSRRGFATKLNRKRADGEAPPEPPARLLHSVKYRTPAGDLAAYISPRPPDGKKRPAMIWLFGGFSNSIDENAWHLGPSENDQSATAFREAGIIMMYPSLRGGNKNPGFIEGFYGEVDDVLAAVDFLTKLDYVDAKRIYLGGHSTGGTLALLVAESTDRFRGIFAFGPVEDASGYGAENLPFDISDRKEVELRSPGKWLQAIRNPTFVFEGTSRRSNIASVMAMSRVSQNSQIHFHPVKGGDHFSILAPVSGVIAAKILRDEGPVSNISFTEKELSDALHK